MWGVESNYNIDFRVSHIPSSNNVLAGAAVSLELIIKAYLVANHFCVSILALMYMLSELRTYKCQKGPIIYLTTTLMNL